MTASSRLRHGYLRHRRRHGALLLLLGFAMGLTLTAMSGLDAGMHSAVQRGTALDVAGQDYQLTPKSDAAASELAGLGAVQMAQAPATLRAGSAAIPVTLTTTTTDPARLLVITRGTAPTRAGEVVITEAAASALGLRVGSRASLGFAAAAPRDVTVVAVGADPRDAGRLAVADAAGHLEAAHITGWAAGETFVATPKVAALGERGGFFLRSVQSMTQDAERSLPALVRYGTWAVAALTVVWVAGAAGVLMGLRRAYQPDVAALRQSGHVEPDTFFATLALTLLGLGVAAGVAAAEATLAWMAVPISAGLGQRWVDVPVPGPAGWVCVAVAVIAPFVVLIAIGAARRADLVRRRGSWLVVLAAAGTLVVAQVIGAAGPTFWILTLTAAAFSAVVWGLLHARRSPTTTAGRLRQRLAAPLLPVTVGLGAVALVLTGTVVGMSGGLAYAAETFVKTQPPGSLVAEGLTDAAAKSAAAEFVRAGGGKALTYELPDESTSSVRVFHPGIERCMRAQHLATPMDAPPACDSSGSPVPVNVIALVDDPRAPEVAADPRLLERGRIAVARPGADGAPWTVLTPLPATVDDRLGGSLPAVLVRAGSATATRLGLTGSGTFGAVLPQATSLTPRAFASVYGALNSAAGTGVLLEQGFDDGGEAMMGAILLLVGVLVVLVLMIGSLRSFVDGHAPTRAALAATGGDPRSIRALFARPIVTMGAVALFGTLLGWGLAAARSPAQPSWWWLATPAALAACSVVGLVWNRGPRSWGGS